MSSSVASPLWSKHPLSVRSLEKITQFRCRFRAYLCELIYLPSALSSAFTIGIRLMEFRSINISCLCGDIPCQVNQK